MSVPLCGGSLLFLIGLGTYQTLTAAVLGDALATVAWSVLVPLTCLGVAVAALQLLRLPSRRFLAVLIVVVASCGVEIAGERVALSMVDPNSPLELDYVGDWIVYRRPTALPRLQLTADVVHLDDSEASKAHLLQPSSGPVSVDVDTGELDGTDGSVDLRVDGNDRIEVGIESDGRHLLVLRDVNAPGWAVTVDGEEQRMITVDHAFRGVVVPEGSSTVEFTYRPAGLVVGGIGGGALAVALMGGLFVYGRPRERR